MKRTIYNSDMKYYKYMDVVVACYNKSQAFDLIESSYHNDIEFELIEEVTSLHAFGSFIKELALSDSQLSTIDSYFLFGEIRNDFVCYGFNDKTLTIV